jgi:phosphocarrier protein
MPRIEKEFIVSNPQGVHARPAAMIVQIASKYTSDTTIEKDKEQVNGKSIMGILTLGMQQNSRIRIIIDGDDAREAMNEIEQLFIQENL